MTYFEDSEILNIDASYAADGKVQRYFPLGRGSGIAVYENLIPKLLCEELMFDLNLHWDRLVREGKLWRGITMGGDMPTTKNTWDTRIERELLEEDYDLCWGRHESEILPYTRSVVNDYVMQYTNLHAFTYPLEDSGYQIQTYKRGEGFYDEHIDGGPFMPVPHRLSTMIVYLNDVDVGGETYFPLQNLKVSPVAGRVLMFPSNFTHPHKGEVPITQSKTILSTFISNKGLYELVNPGIQDWTDRNAKFDDKSHNPFKPVDQQPELPNESSEPIEVFNEF